MARRPLTVPVTGPFWVGQWGNWPNQAGTCAWFVASDEDSQAGCPYTYIMPGIGWGPGGWTPANQVWPWTNALGIGYFGHRSLDSSGAPEPGRRERARNWGKVKALYR